MTSSIRVDPSQFEVVTDGPVLRGESSGKGRDMVLCHGLSATRRYVVHGSRVLPRSGYRLHVFDARGHGESDPADRYDYGGLCDDLEAVVESQTTSTSLILGGHSMGCHTALAFALRHPGQVAALILAGPVFTGEEGELDLARWDERADALETGGPAAFARAIGSSVEGPEAVRQRIMRLAEGRAELHRHPEAVAEALRQVPRSRPFDSIGQLASLDIPALVIGSHDQFDEGHPYAVARRYADELPAATMISEAEGEPPLTWQGGRMSREIVSFLDAAGLGPPSM